MEKLNYNEFKELMRAAFSAGVAAGKKMKPIEQIPMGSKIQSANKAFESFFERFVEDVKAGPQKQK